MQIGIGIGIWDWDWDWDLGLGLDLDCIMKTYCISLHHLRQPVVAADGHTYEKMVIVKCSFVNADVNLGIDVEMIVGIQTDVLIRPLKDGSKKVPSLQ